MKTSILTSIVVLFVAVAGFSQDYDADLQSLLPRVGEAKSAADYGLLASQLGSLAQSEPNRWEASFWSAHCMVLQAFAETNSDKVDPILDAAEPVVEKLIKQQPTEPEFYVLMAMLNQARIGVNPMLRGMKYSGRANENLELALQFDAANPRAWHLKGSNTYFTPAMFGGGKKRAMPMLQKADSLFKTFKPRTPYHPNWGAERNAELLKACAEDQLICWGGWRMQQLERSSSCCPRRLFCLFCLFCLPPDHYPGRLFAPRPRFPRQLSGAIKTSTL